MDISVTKHNISEHTYSERRARTETAATGFSRLVREAEERLQQEEAGNPLPAEALEKEGEDLWQAIAHRKEEIIEKLRNGDTEETFQIGADSYTLKEWERMMEQFDSLEEVIRHMMSERARKQRQQAYWQVLGKPEQEETEG